MRLLHTDRMQFYEFFGSDLPAYAILSHRWEDEEVTYQDMMSDMAEARGKNTFWGHPKKETSIVRNKKGFKKIEQCCQRAQKDGLEYVWVDTCNIDKSSSAELSEAINSRY
jgi:hypothetical protein